MSSYLPAVFLRFHAFRERWEVLFHKLRRFGPEALSVEIFERPGGGVKDEPQPPRAERLPLFAVGAVVLFAAVFPVAKQRTSGMAELRADLVRAPGDKAALHKRETPVGCDRFILRHGGLRPGAGRIVDIDLVILRVLEEIPLEPSGGGARCADDGGEIDLLDLAVFDLFIHDAQRLGVFRRDHDAAGIAVDAIAERGRKAVLPRRVPLALCAEIRLDIGDERIPAPLPRAVAEDARLFVHEQDVFVLIDDIEPGGRDLAPGIFLPRRFKKLVREIDAHRVALGEARLALCRAAVDLYILFPQRLLQQRFRDKRRRLAHEPVEPLPGVVPADGKFLHCPSASVSSRSKFRSARRRKNAVAHADTTSAIGKHHHTLPTFPVSDRRYAAGMSATT